MKDGRVQKRVLIIEDEELIVEVLRDYFAVVAPEIEVVFVSTLEEARQKLQESKWDLCICDCHLPDGTACDLFEERAFSCPVIITTGYINQEGLNKAKNFEKLELVLKKPYLAKELFQKVKKILNNRP